MGFEHSGFASRKALGLRGFNPYTINPKPHTLPVAQKTYLFKELYIETIIRNPKRVGLFGYSYTLNYI